MSNIWNLNPPEPPKTDDKPMREVPNVRVFDRPNARIPGAIDLLLLKKYGVKPNNDEEE